MPSSHYIAMVDLKIYLIVQVSRRNARKVVGSGLMLHITEVFTNISKIKSKAEEKTIFDHVRQLFFKNSGVWPLLTSSKRPRPGLGAGEGFD